MAKKSLPLSKVYQLLEPGPVVLVSSAYKGKTNIMTLSWHMMMEFEPPLIGCVISNRNYSFELIKKSKACAINIPSADLIDAVVNCGNSSGVKINKFSQFNLTAVPAQTIPVPLIKECFANLECKLVDSSRINKYCQFIFEVQQAWFDPKIKRPQTIHHRGNGVFMLAGEQIKTRSKMK